MNRHDPKTIKLLFSTLEAGGVRLPESFHSDAGWALAVDLWAGILADVSVEDLVAAVSSFLRSPDARFFPTPGQILDHVPGRRTFDDGDATWGEVLALAGRKGRENPPLPLAEIRELPPVEPGSLEEKVRGLTRRWALDEKDEARDAAIHVALGAVGGWRGLCLLETDQITAGRASFRSAYRAELERRRALLTQATSRALLEEAGAGRRLLDDRRTR